jgi:hypothetical protein
MTHLYDDGLKQKNSEFAISGIREGVAPSNSRYWRQHVSLAYQQTDNRCTVEHNNAQCVKIFVYTQ